MSRDYYFAGEREEEVRLALAAQKRWELHLEKLISLGAGSRANAIRWDMDAENAHNGGVPDVGFYCYLSDLDYTLERSIQMEIQ